MPLSQLDRFQFFIGVVLFPQILFPVEHLPQHPQKGRLSFDFRRCKMLCAGVPRARDQRSQPAFLVRLHVFQFAVRILYAGINVVGGLRRAMESVLLSEERNFILHRLHGAADALGIQNRIPGKRLVDIGSDR